MTPVLARPPARTRRWAVTGLLLLPAGTLLIQQSPRIVAWQMRRSMADAGLDQTSLRVESLGPFHSELRDVSFSRGPLEVVLGHASGDYSPLRLFRAERLDALTLDKLFVRLDLDSLRERPGDDSPAVLFPQALDALPIDRLLIQNATLRLTGRQVNLPLQVNGLVDASAGASTLALGISGGGDELLLTVDKSGVDGDIRANGRLSPMQWLHVLGPLLDLHLPEDLRLTSAPVQVDGLLKVLDRMPARWAATLRIPAVRMNSGAVQVEGHGLTVGVTGDAGRLERLVLQGRFGGNAGDWHVQPFESSWVLEGSDELSVDAEAIHLSRGDAVLELRGVEAVATLVPALGSAGRNELRVDLRLGGLEAAQVAKLFPQFEGALSGTISGELHLGITRDVDGHFTLTIFPGTLELSEGTSAQFSYPDAGNLLGGNMATDAIARSLQSLTLTRLVVRLAPKAGTPVSLTMSGRPNLDGGVEIGEFNLDLQGDIVELLENLLGGISIRFAPESEPAP